MSTYKGSPELSHPKTATRIHKVRELVTTLHGIPYRLIVEGGQTRSCGYERAAIFQGNTHRVALGVYRWLNRPWQRFSGEEATIAALKQLRFGKDLEDVFLLRAKAMDEAEAEKVFNDFQAAYNKLTDKGRELLAKSGAEVHDLEDAKTLTVMMGLGALFGL